MSLSPAFALVGVLGSACAPISADGSVQEPAPVGQEGQDADAFYDPDVVQDVELTIADADIARMDAALPERIYVPAMITWGDVVVADVGVRYKGNSSSIPGVSMQRSFLVHTNEFVDGQRFLGLKHLAFDNGCQFGAVFSQRLITDILQRKGVIAPRASYARISVNGAYQGVYVNEERIDGVFLTAQLGNNDGQLYKVDEGGPGGDLSLVDRATAAATFQAENHEDTADASDVVALMEAIADRSVPIESLIDVHAFIRLMAVMALTGAFDQYTGWNAHNYYLYRDPDTQLWLYLPHDLDVGFADHAFGQIDVIDGWDVGRPLPVSPRPLLERIFEDDALFAEYQSEARATLEEETASAVLTPRLDALYAQVHEDLDDEPWPAARLTNPDDTDWDSIVSSMKSFITRRASTADEQLR